MERNFKKTQKNKKRKNTGVWAAEAKAGSFGIALERIYKGTNGSKIWNNVSVKVAEFETIPNSIIISITRLMVRCVPCHCSALKKWGLKKEIKTRKKKDERKRKGGKRKNKRTPNKGTEAEMKENRHNGWRNQQKGKERKNWEIFFFGRTYGSLKYLLITFGRPVWRKNCLTGSGIMFDWNSVKWELSEANAVSKLSPVKR